MRFLLLFALSASLLSAKDVRITNGNVAHPEKYKVAKPEQIVFKMGDYTVQLYAERIAQGQAAYLEIIGKDINRARAYFKGRYIPLVKTSFGYRGLFGIKTYEKLGPAKLSVTVNSKSSTFNIPIKDTKYATYKASFAVKNWSNTSKLARPKVIAMKKRDKAKKRKVFAATGPDTLTQFRSHPRDMHRITSPFYQKRVISRFKMKGKKKIKLKPRVTRHYGTDLKGLTGAPIYALTTGRVVIAQRMFFEGNFVVLDHGNKIFTGYMHLSKIQVKEGQLVKAGQLLGKTGATGAVTGPHLHVFLRLRGIYVEALSILPLPIRN